MTMIDEVRTQRALPETMKHGYDTIRKMDKTESVRLWSALTGKALEILRQRAQLIFHFHEEGWDIHELGNGHAYYYLRIAHGQMLPELFIAIADPALLDRVSKLPIPDQERVAKNDKVKVLLNFKESGQPYFQEMELANLAPKHAAMVLHGNRICDEKAQIAHARTMAGTNREPHIGTLTPDVRRGGATSKIGNITVFYDWAQIEAALSARK